MSNNPRVTKLIYPNYNKVDENTNVIKEYVYNNSTPIATMTSTKTYKVYADHLNTSRRVADNINNQIIWKWESSPFGETKATGTLTHNLRFPGQYFDAETNTHYNINRDYNPVTGRYIQSDPIGFDGGVNGFGYVGGMPMTHVDLMGLWASQKGFYVHQDANQRVLGAYLGMYQVEILNSATDAVDRPENQTGTKSYKHAMTGTWDDEGRDLIPTWYAKSLSNNWVREQYSKAQYFKSYGDMDSALFYFGQALHTLQDSTSPSHSNFKPWTGHEHIGKVAKHIIGEIFYWQTTNTNLDFVTEVAYSWFYWDNLPSGELFTF